MQIDRRRFLRVLGGGTISTYLVGCGAPVTPSANRNITAEADEANAPAEVVLTFSDTQEFYEKLSTAIKSNNNVVLKFNGTNKVGENSRLITEFIVNAVNCEELWTHLKEKDTDAGRKDLGRVFNDELLGHRPLNGHPNAPDGQVTLPSGEVIEPATVILVLGIILILAAASVAHAESARGRKYSIGIREPAAGFELYFQGEP